MSIESNTMMYIIKDEPQAEVTEINSVCEETFTEIEGVEPKQEEELNSAFIKHDFQINEDYCGVYDGTSVKHESYDITIGFNCMPQNHAPPFYNTSEASTRNETEIHLITSKNDGTYQLPTEVALNHNNEFKCQLCCYSTKLKHCLLRHVEVHHGAGDFKCHLCSYSSNFKERLLRHVEVHHGSEEYKCDQCNFTTKLKELLLAHLRECHDFEEFECQFCSYVTKLKQNLSRHVKVHYDSEEFKCNQCNFTTKLKELLLTHMRGCHEFKEFKCRFCSYVTKQKHNLSRHVKVHKNFKCHHCSFVTKWKTSLRKHVKTHHGLKKSFNTYQ